MSRRDLERQQGLLYHVLVVRHAETRGRDKRPGKDIPSPELDALDFKSMSQEERDFYRYVFEEAERLALKRGQGG